MNNLIELLTLFATSFLAATILPLQSELLLATFSINALTSNVVLISVATLGNVLGSVVNWFLGRFLISFKDRKWFPVKEKMLKKSEILYSKYGKWTLLFAWLPLIGDAFTVIAGVFKLNMIWFLVLVTIGKSLRYISVIAIAQMV